MMADRAGNRGTAPGRQPFVLAAGGTGGHLFPAEALAGALVERGWPVHLLTDARAEGFAARLPGIPIHRIAAGRLGGNPVQAAKGLAGLAFGMLQARSLLRRLSPAAVIGFGGYPSVPTVLAAQRLRLPTILHEQNAVLGRANRLLARRATAIATGFPDLAGLDAAERGRVSHTGNPVRPAIAALAASAYRAPDETAAIELLVLGGSQGARIFGELVPPALALLPEGLRRRVRLSQQARPEELTAVAARLAEQRIVAEVQSFFTDVPERLARAHLLICRAGASTIAELAAAGRPALLVPYPHAMDDHQAANARAYAATGAGWEMPQATLTPAVLAERLARLLGYPDTLSRAAARARKFAPRDAAAALAGLALTIGGAKTNRERAA